MTATTHDLTQPGTIFRPFPAAEEVFSAEQTSLARHLHPLVSIDLSAADPAWSGWIHLLSPIEPSEGYVGAHTPMFHSPLLRTNCIGFGIVDGRYRLLGDPRYFLLENSADTVPGQYPGVRAELEQHYRQQQAAYEASRDYYRQNGKLVRLDRSGKPAYGCEDAIELVETLGINTGYGNWTGTAEFACEIEDDDEDGKVWPLSPAGRRFQQVATVPGWHYRTVGADSILLFYEPVEQLALLTFDWT